MGDAIAREKKLKKLPRAAKIALIDLEIVTGATSRLRLRRGVVSPDRSNPYRHPDTRRPRFQSSNSLGDGLAMT